jgi:hypothetical protein
VILDITVEDRKYWEAVLAESNLSAINETPPIQISAEEFEELSNVDLLPEEDYEREDDPVIKFNGITRDTDTLNADHSGLSLTNHELRTKIDSEDTFFTGHRIIKERRGNRPCPDWAVDSNKLRELLLRAFPKLHTNEKQRSSAGRWARVIQLYYRSQMTHGQICAELGLSLPTVASMVRSIDRAAAGKTADKAKGRKGRRGRSKK